jgi:hypothetical protein
MRNQRQIPRLKELGWSPFQFEKTASARHDMKHEAVLKGRNLKSPRSSEFGATVERSAHAQEVKGLAHRIRDCWQFHSHDYEYALTARSYHPDFLDERAIYGDEQALLVHAFRSTVDV